MMNVRDVIEAMQRFEEKEVSITELDEIFLEYLNNAPKYRTDNAPEFEKNFTRCVADVVGAQHPYYCLSACMKLTNDVRKMEEIIRLCIADDNLSCGNKYYIYCQIITYKFFNSEFNTNTIKNLLDDLYECIFEDYRRMTKDYCGWIKASERNEDLVIIFIAQVLELEHGPTKTLFDRAYVLQNKLNKKVFIINTGDVATRNNSVPWFGAMGANYVDTYQEVDSLQYQDEVFSFFQCPPVMPEISVMQEIINVISEEKPWFILSLGSANITADLCAQIVPTLTVNLGFSELAETRSRFQAVGRPIELSDIEWMDKHSIPHDHYIESLFTFALKPQSETLTREQLGMSSDAVICIVIGGRLFSEIDDEFINLVLRLGRMGIHVAFAGLFDNYDDYVQRYPELKDTTYNLGFQTDILAVCECCDIYINPRRAGGGTSVVEAMFKGLPALTPAYGDVARSAGSEFYVADYDEMYDHVMRLANDRNYYDMMSAKSIDRARKVMDSETEFVRIINEMTSREGFY
ncbi:MAG: hypothetical protein IJ058_01790 [Lachnospiraceae bacterium]|nr:hypothetical protein [Lachnospiraceae bacterium]